MNVVERSFGINFKILKLFAIYPPDNCRREMFRIYGLLHQVLFTVGFPVLGISYLITDRKSMDMNQVVDSLFVFSQLSLFPLKHFPFLIKYEKLNNLVNTLGTKSFVEVLPEQEKYIEKSISMCRNTFKLLCFLCTGCCICYTFRPIYFNISIPSEIWWPFDYNNSNSFSRYFAWFYCVYSGCHGVFSTSALDGMITGLVIHATGQIKILKDNIKYLNERADEAVGSFAEPQRTFRKHKIIRNKLNEYAEHYNQIIWFMRHVENLLSTVAFAQIFGSVVVICMLCYMLTLVGLFSLSGISFLVYLVAIGFHVFFHCFFGNDLIAESNSITEAIYMSNWFEYDNSSKKILILIMERAKKPLKQTGGGFVVLSLSLFVTVLKQAYSLMAVLQSRN